MTTLSPRSPYTAEELKQIYPDTLQLQFVQILLRHGERSPVSARFQNAGLPSYWPYCSVARQMISATYEQRDGKWSDLQWRRRIETFGNDDGPVMASGPNGEIDAVCNLGELTDKGRETTAKLGQRLRNLYVDQLKFMPPMIEDADMIYLRATPIPRALESLQQAFWGMYPEQHRSAKFPPVTIITRAPADETLFPNDSNCRRFAQLSRAFAQRTADRYNDSDDVKYLDKLIGKWMPDRSAEAAVQNKVAVDSHPRLSGIMDTINSTLAHGPATRLPKEFYDERGRKIIDRIGVEEWFSGYQESREYRMLGIGGLMGDVVERMVGSVEGNHNDGIYEIGGKDGSPGLGRGGEKSIKLGLSGCHDTTLAAILASLGAFEGEQWPPYTSHIALELFRSKAKKESAALDRGKIEATLSNAPKPPTTGWFSRLFTSNTAERTGESRGAAGIARKGITELSDHERSKLEDYYVRIRYNDKVMSVPGCKPEGKHLDGDESFCTLDAFKSIVDKYTPKHWKQDCQSNMKEAAFPKAAEPSGF